VSCVQSRFTGGVGELSSAVWSREGVAPVVPAFNEASDGGDEFGHAIEMRGGWLGG